MFCLYTDISLSLNKFDRCPDTVGISQQGMMTLILVAGQMVSNCRLPAAALVICVTMRVYAVAGAIFPTS